MTAPVQPYRVRVTGCVQDYLNGLRAAKRSPHTVNAYRRDLTSVVAIMAAATGGEVDELALADLTGPLLREAFGHFAGPRAPASVERAWTTWNQFLAFCVAEGLMPGNPMPAVPRPKPTPLSPKPLHGDNTPEQLLEAVAAGRRRARNPWPERDLAVISVALLTGMRLAELLSLKVHSIAGRPGERRIDVVGKGGKPRSIPIEEPLYEVINIYLDSRRRRFRAGEFTSEAALLVDNQNNPMRRGGLQYLVRQCYRHAGIHGQVPRGALVHALRHVFATRLAEDGASASEIAKLLGHSSLATAQNYIDATAREQRNAVRATRTYAAVRRLVGD
jgi:integrase/recombinase XerD